MASVTYGKCYLWQKYYVKCNYGKNIMANETEPFAAFIWNHKIPLGPDIPKMWSAFYCEFNITGDMKNFVQISTILVFFNQNC